MTEKKGLTNYVLKLVEVLPGSSYISHPCLQSPPRPAAGAPTTPDEDECVWAVRSCTSVCGGVRNSGCLFPVNGSLIRVSRFFVVSTEWQRAQLDGILLFRCFSSIPRMYGCGPPSASTPANCPECGVRCILKTNLSGSYSTRSRLGKSLRRINCRKDRHKPLDAPTHHAGREGQR